MGFRFRKSINLGGGFRINLSKSGVGYSWGTKGARITKTARGTTRSTLSVPGTGISYVNETSNAKKRKSSPAAPSPSNNTMTQNLYDSTEIVNEKVESLSSEGLDELLSAAQKSMDLDNAFLVGMVITLFLCYVNPLFFILSVAFLALKIRTRIKGVISLEYDIDETEKETVEQRAALLLKIIQCKKVWRLTTTAKVADKKYAAGASNAVKRVLCKTSESAPFPLKSNVSAPTLKTGDETLIFLPDKLFLIQKGKIGAVNYSDITFSTDTTNFIEQEVVPSDAKVVDQTWKYVNKSGKPDKRFKDNKKLPICLYGELSLTSQSGLNTIILFSNADAV